MFSITVSNSSVSESSLSGLSSVTNFLVLFFGHHCRFHWFIVVVFSAVLLPGQQFASSPLLGAYSYGGRKVGRRYGT